MKYIICYLEVSSTDPENYTGGEYIFEYFDSLKEFEDRLKELKPTYYIQLSGKYEQL